MKWRVLKKKAAIEKGERVNGSTHTHTHIIYEDKYGVIPPYRDI